MRKRFKQTLQPKWKAGTVVRVQSGCHVLTHYSRRRHTAEYSIPSPYVFHKIIRLSNATQNAMHITSVDDESTHRGVRIRMQTVNSVAEGDNVRSTRSNEYRPTQLMHERLKQTPQLE